MTIIKPRANLDFNSSWLPFWRRYFRRLLVALALCQAYAANAEQFQVFTEHLPPYQIVKDGQPLDGMAVQIVRTLLTRVGVDVEIEVVPWARAYDMALNRPNILIFSVLRSVEREELFYWVGDILTQEFSFFALSEEEGEEDDQEKSGRKRREVMTIRSFADAKKYVTGVTRDSFEHQLLVKHRFIDERDLALNVRQQPLIDMLYKQHVDLLLGTKTVLRALESAIKPGPSRLKQVYKVKESPGNISIAISKKTDRRIVARFQRAFIGMKEDGSYQRIVNDRSMKRY